MTNELREELKIEADELDWDRAEVQPGRRHGTVISVRLSTQEADHLRELALELGLNMSQVLRRALEAYGHRPRPVVSGQAFTFGGVDLPPESIRLFPENPHQRASQPTSTELRPRIRERVSS